MFAPRRLGKSWLMKNLLRKEAADKGWQTVYCDLQSANSYEKAVLTLIDDLQKHGNTGESLLSIAKAKFKGILKGEPASFKELLSHTDPENLLDAILSHLNQDSQEKPTLLLLDEVTICASNIMKLSPDECYQLLNSLRRFRDAYPNIRWMLTGSIGLDHFAKHHQVSGAFNNLHPFLIEPFSPDIATDFVNNFSQQEVPASFTLDSKTHQYLQNRLGWLSPYYLEKLCLKIIPLTTGKTLIANCNAIDLACHQLLQYPHNQAFSGWPEHLERNIPDEIRPSCKAILNKLSEHETGESRDSLRAQLEPEHTPEQVREALTILSNDGFIKKQASGKYSFVMQLLANYWQEYQA